MSLIQLIGVFLFSAAASMVLASYQRQKQKPASPQPFQTPTVPAGTRIPVVYGTWRVRPILVWFGGVKVNEVKTLMGPSGFVHIAPTEQVLVGYEYAVTCFGVLCWGGAAANNMIFGETGPAKTLKGQPATQTVGEEGIEVTRETVSGGGFIGSGALALDTYSGGRAYNDFFLPTIYGGKGRGGGVGGRIHFAMGSGQYGPDLVMEAALGEGRVPSYNLLATVTYENLVMGESPVPPAIDYIIRSKGGEVSPRMVGPAGKQWLVQDTSAAHILQDALTNRFYGQGEPEWKLNLSSFTAAHDQLVDEGLGMSLCIGGAQGSGPNIQTFQQLKEECERTAGGILRENAETGQWEFVLLRDASASYDTLPEYTEEHFESLEWNETQPGEVINRLTVEYSDAAKLYQTDTVTLDNAANIAMTGTVRPDKVQFLAITDRDTALKVGARTLKERSTPLGRGQGKATRALWSALPGDVIKITHTRHRLLHRVVRVLSVDLGLPEDPTIGVTFIDDVFSQPTIGRVDDPRVHEPTPIAIIRPSIIAISQSVAAGVGTLTFTVLDPEHRITSIAKNTKSGTAAASGWTDIATASPDTSDPTFPFNDHVTDDDLSGTYDVDVPLSGLAESAIQIRLRYVGYSSIDNPLEDIQELLTQNATFPALRRTGVPVLSYVYSGSDVIVTATAPDASSVKIAGDYDAEPSDADIRAATADSSSPFTATFAAPDEGEVLYVGAFAYEGSDESARSAPLTIPGPSLGVTGVTPGTYGDATNVPQVTVDATGRITDIDEVPISGSVGGASFTRFSGDRPPASPSALDDRFPGSSLDGKWTTVDNASPGVFSATVNDGLVLRQGTSAAGALSTLLQAIPGGVTDFTVACQCTMSSAPDMFGSAGLVLTDGTTTSSKLIIVANQGRDSLSGKGIAQQVQYFSDYSTFINQPVDLNRGMQFNYFRVRRVSSTYYAGFSRDGIAWTEKIISPAFTPTHLGVGCAGDQSNAWTLEASFRWFQFDGASGTRQFGGRITVLY